MAFIEYRYPTFPKGPNAIRTQSMDAPRFRDEWSFAGLGRSTYQHVNVDRLNIPHPTPPIVPAVETPTGPAEPRG